MRKPTGGKRPDPSKPSKPPAKGGQRPGKPGAYSQRLIRQSMKGARPPSREDGEAREARKPSSRLARNEDAQKDRPGRGQALDTTLTKFRTRKGGAPTRGARTPDAGEGRSRESSRERPRRHGQTDANTAPLGGAAKIRKTAHAPAVDGSGAQREPRGRPLDTRAGRPPLAFRPSAAKPPGNRPPREGYSVPATPAARPDLEPRGPAERMRIAKAMARAGLCSRRDGERWIAEGRVSVNGRILTAPGVEVGPADRILVDGQPLPSAEPAQLWRYYKPRGLVTTHADPEGRPTVFDALPPELPRVISIGRLDFNTEGLLLLTNDGALARYLELPSTGWLRRYRVRAHGRVSQADLDGLKEGVTIEGVRYAGIDATIDSVQAGNMWLTIGLREGKNREVRRILGSLALEVNRLIRVSYGPFQLMDLTPGAIEPVKRRILADQLGPAAAEFGLTGAIDGYKARQVKDGGKPRKPRDAE